MLGPNLKNAKCIVLAIEDHGEKIRSIDKESGWSIFDMEMSKALPVVYDILTSLSLFSTNKKNNTKGKILILFITDYNILKKGERFW